MDNRVFDITSDQPSDLKAALQIAMRHPAIGFMQSGNALVFYWSPREGITQMPFKMNSDDVMVFASRWLEQAANYPPEPDCGDGSAHKAWRIYCERWGHVDGQWEAMFAIQPVWGVCGK